MGVEGSSWSKCPGPGLSGFEWEGRVKKLKHRPSKGQEGWKMGESGAVIVRYQGIHTLPRYLCRYLGSDTPQQVVGGHPWTYDSGCRQAVGTGTNLNLLRNHPFIPGCACISRLQISRNRNMLHATPTYPAAHHFLSRLGFWHLQGWLCCAVPCIDYLPGRSRYIWTTMGVPRGFIPSGGYIVICAHTVRTSYLGT